MAKQSSDAGEKNKLVEQSASQRDPYQAEGKDFPVKSVSARTGQSGSHGTAEGKNQLASAPDSPRTIEDDGWGEHGSGTPVPVDRGARVASAIKVEQNPGEGSSGGDKVSISESVSLVGGHIEGGSVTRVKEVPESKVSIGSRR